MLRKRSVDNRRGPTFPAQALPWSGSTGMISAFSAPFKGKTGKAPRESEKTSLAKEFAKIQAKKLF